MSYSIKDKEVLDICRFNVSYATTFYRPRSRGDNTFGSVRLSVCLSVHDLLSEPFSVHLKGRMVNIWLCRVQQRRPTKHKSRRIYHYQSKIFGCACDLLLFRQVAVDHTFNFF